MFYILRANVAGRCHMGTRVHAPWQRECVTGVRMCVCVPACVGTCARESD